MLRAWLEDSTKKGIHILIDTVTLAAAAAVCTTHSCICACGYPTRTRCVCVCVCLYVYENYVAKLLIDFRNTAT